MTASTNDIALRTGPAVDPPEEDLRRHPLRIAAFSLLWIGLVISITGDHLYRVALTLEVADQGAPGLAALGVALALPTAVIGLFSGVLVDTHDRLRLLVRADVARATIVLLLGILLFDPEPSLVSILVLATLLAFVSVIFTPALQAVLPDLAGGNKDTLISMDAWILGALSVLGVLGPAVAGLSLRYLGSGALMVLDAATFGFSALMILQVRRLTRLSPSADPGAEQRKDKDRPRRPSGLAAVREGLGFLMRHPVLGPCFRTFPFMDFALGSVPFVLPLLYGSDDATSASYYGAMLAALAAGRVLGMALLNRTDLRLHRGAVLRFNFLLQGLGVLLFAACGQSWLGIVPMILVGLPAGAAQIAMSSYIQIEVEPQMRGRVFAALISFVTWLAPFGPLVFVFVAAELSPAVALLAIATTLLVGGVHLLLCRPLAAMR